MIRVISGKYRRRQLKYISDESTRPTQDRVKEAIFSALGEDVQDRIVLDLFAGSGAMAIEALSRGAKQATFVDLRPAAIKVIKENLELLKIEKQEVIESDYKDYLNNYDLKKFDLIFLDPPYSFKELDSLIDTLCNNISKQAIFVVELNHPHEFKAVSFNKIREYKISKKYIYIVWR